MKKEIMTGLAEVVLAALFHDLGKFGQRAGAVRSENLKETYCPKTSQGWHSHIHVLNTDHFIEKILPLSDHLGNRSIIAKLAANHHKTDWDSLAESCIAIADHLASGADRSKGDGEQNEDNQGYIESRLISIFQEIELLHHRFEPSSNLSTYSLQRIDVDAYPSIKPGKTTKEAKKEYKLHWEQFTEELSRHPLLHDKRIQLPQYLSILSTTLERYLWCVPAASFKTIPDISLHDHGALTAALAQALWVWHSTNDGKPVAREAERDTPKFLLYGGDLSGIQAYIFNLNKSHSTGIAKLYRARSFYLQMITKSAVLEILDRLGLLPVAQVMDAGGRFMLILPNTPAIHSALDELEKEFNHQFLRNFNGLISLNNCRLEASFNDLLLPNFKQTLNSFYDQLDQAKLKKFSKSFEDHESMIIENEYEDGYESNCQVCEYLPYSEKGTQLYLKDYPDSNVKLSEIVAQQICWIGKDLANEEKSHLVLTTDEFPRSVPLIGKWRVAVVELEKADQALYGGAWTFNRQGYGDHAFHPIAGYLPKINERDLERWSENDRSIDMLREEEEPRQGLPKSFSMIANAGKHWLPARGKSFIGAFKGDVDNLGMIFSMGLVKEKNRLSISRYASLSRMLNHFFSVELVHLIRKEAPDCYVIFSGGDDLFFLGPWIDVIELGLMLRKKFDEFTSQNEDISLSAGIAISRSTLPVREIASQAESQLDEAKKFNQENRFKNAVSLFGEVIPWSTLPRLLKRGWEIDQFLEQGILPSGLVNRLLLYSRQRKRYLKSRQIKDGLYLAHLAYDFARNLEPKQFEKNGFTKADHARFVGDWSASDSDHLATAEIPIHFALYRHRK